jgi:hypothetical protein
MLNKLVEFSSFKPLQTMVDNKVDLLDLVVAHRSYAQLSVDLEARRPPKVPPGWTVLLSSAKTFVRGYVLLIVCVFAITNNPPRQNHVGFGAVMYANVAARQAVIAFRGYWCLGMQVMGGSCAALAWVGP